MIRSDAARNRAKVLEAAEAVLDEQGLSARMDEIARRAGVGVGTLYRHFATKEALYQAIVAARIDQLLEEADRLRAGADPAAAFFTFFTRIVDGAARQRTLTDALRGAGIDVKAHQTEQQAAMRRAIDDLLRAAQAAGAVREDVALPEILALLRGAGLAAETGTYPVGIVLDGLRRPA
ncbi:helix-turn-helix domain-containing protein [Dactylosporangium sp. AC04546]|uniref:TetR/AcrR family transcriptional regulator n=1 Tax=Dactylosporangium sp. AC04546 TaxID=2862460 RepID=UPI001EE00107|nr:TetR/AcrR family transcriptional regulator [Dactylosporangium sp. AC04546]WVK88100.1 helix-turn-helix domain-containing protein [Dactylosporangium sp. AC04546]